MYFLELHGVGGEDADAFGGLFRGHGVLVEQQAEFFFVELQAVDGASFAIAGQSLRGTGALAVL